MNDKEKKELKELLSDPLAIMAEQLRGETSLGAIQVMKDIERIYVLLQDL